MRSEVSVPGTKLSFKEDKDQGTKRVQQSKIFRSHLSRFLERSKDKRKPFYYTNGPLSSRVILV